MAGTNSGLSGLSLKQTIALTAVVTAAATTSVILSYNALRREVRTERLKRQVGDEVDKWEHEQEAGTPGIDNEDADEWSIASAFPKGQTGEKVWRDGEYDESLIREQLTRNYNFLGEESMAKIRKSYVVVVGCGGVGSWCALMLLRSGVQRLLLIDFDMTTLSSLNRHACATLEDVGTPKVVAMQKYFRKIAPWAKVDVKVGLWRKGNESESWLEGADYVVDAIDNIDTKVDLLAHCVKSKIPVFASMGAGAKRDPTRVQIADISNTYEDPLARSVRAKLRKRGVSSGIPVVYSTEVPGEVKLLPLPEEEFKKGAVKELQAFDDFRVRILPVLGPLPATFGLFAATYILLSLGDKPLTDAAAIKNRRKLYSVLERNLSEREARVAGQPEQKAIPLSADDLAYIFEDLNCGRPTLPAGAQGVSPKPMAVRWDRTKPLTVDNVVILAQKDADRHERDHLKGGEPLDKVWSEKDIAWVERKAEEARKVWLYRRI